MCSIIYLLLAGTSVASGDFNGDGFDDVIAGALYGSSTASYAGYAYVIFGRNTTLSPLSSPWDKNDLDGSEGFMIYGTTTTYDYLGASVGSADVNGDGYDDILVGASGASIGGVVYVIYGGASVGSSGSIYVSALTTSTGFTLSSSTYYDYLGAAVSGAGDVNNDGYEDFIAGAKYYDVGSTYSVGGAFVVFGGPALTNLVTSGLIGSNGFVISGNALYDYCGTSVAGAGDLNGDGYDDVLVGCEGGMLQLPLLSISNLYTISPMFPFQ